METKDFIDVGDIYTASFLSLKGFEPELVRDYGDHYMFRFPRTNETCRFISEFSVDNPPYPVRDFAISIRKLRARMISAKRNGD